MNCAFGAANGLRMVNGYQVIPSYLWGDTLQAPQQMLETMDHTECYAVSFSPCENAGQGRFTSQVGLRVMVGHTSFTVHHR